MRLATPFSVLFLLGIASICRAQLGENTSLQLNLDARARVASTGTSRSALYSDSVLFKTKLAPGLRFLYTGAQSNARILTGKGRRFDKFVTQEAAVEKAWGIQRLEAGIIRLPFGLYNSEETYASGLIDYPLARVDYAHNAVDWGAPGVRWAGGSPSLQLEASAFGGQASGVWGNRNNVQGAVFRLQTYKRDLILGFSRWDGTESVSTAPTKQGAQPTHLSGLDLRYTRPHLMLRGEYLLGKLGGENMNGWYLDAYYHLPKYHRWTLVARLEEFKANSAVSATKQVTLGVRYTLDHDWIFAMNWRKNNGFAYRGTWTPYAANGGDVFFQVYRKVRF